MRIRVAVAIAFCLFLVPLPAGTGPHTKVGEGAGERVEAPKIMVVNDAPRPSPQFREFFYYFNGALNMWLREGGRSQVRGSWRVTASEYTVEASDARGATILVRRAPPGSRVRWFRTLPFGAESGRTSGLGCINPECVTALGAAASVIEILLDRPAGKPGNSGRR